MIRLPLILTFLSIGLLAKSQYQDALLWTSAELETKLTKDFNAEFNIQSRFDDNVSQVANIFMQATIDYEITGNSRIAFGYRLSNERETYNYFVNQRLFTDLNHNYEITDDFDLKLRLRFQHSYDRLREINSYILPDKRTVLRFRYGFQYKLNNWRPSIHNEWFYDLDDFYAYRINLGLGYKISKRHSIRARFIYQSESLEPSFTRYIYQIGYKYTVKGKIFPNL